MKFPIIELRQENLFLQMNFDGVFTETTKVRIRHNMVNNRTCYVIDSNGDLWSFKFVRTDHCGIRKTVSTLFWNISTDYYTYSKDLDISVRKFQELVEPHQEDLDPDTCEMAQSLLEPIIACNPSDSLRRHMHLLNM